MANFRKLNRRFDPCRAVSLHLDLAMKNEVIRTPIDIEARSQLYMFERSDEVIMIILRDLN